jgi:hypothetical protein
MDLGLVLAKEDIAPDVGRGRELLPPSRYAFSADERCCVEIGQYGSSELGRQALEGVD